MKRLIFLALALAAIAFIACGDSGAQEEGGGTAVQPTTRTIYMEAIEPKGTTNVEKEPFPTEALPPGGGYILEELDEEGKWVIETYVWTPDQIIVKQGDTVNLEIIGINGARHDSFIEEYVDSFVVQRGKLTSLSFVANKPGIFQIVCTTHPPSMTAELIVLPR